MGGRIGVLLELNCETDFVAKNDTFKQLAKDITMQIAAARPLYVSREEVPENVIAAEKEIYRAQAINEGKPEKFADKIVEGKIEKYFKEVCLLDQVYIKDNTKTVSQVVQEVMAILGENIKVRRFARFERGEKLSASEETEN